MFRTSDIVLFAVMVSAAAFTYKTKHDAEGEYARVRKLEAQIRYEQDTIDVLKADWSLLTQPARLQKLSEIFQTELQLKPVEAHQVAGVDELPARPVEIENFSTKQLGGMAETGTDKTVTGGVVR